MISLIDADIIVYRCGFVTENEPVETAIHQAEDMLDDILVSTKAGSFKLYLSDSTENGFRKKLYPEYKANRIQPRPKHYDAIKEHLVLHWNATVTPEQEADDALGIAQTQGEETIICSIDKDLLQIAGNHYNFVKKIFCFVTPEQGLHWFYQQCLIGDASDNVKGVTGIGTKKAGRLLGEVEDGNEEEWFQKTRDAFQNEFGERGDEQLLLTGRLLKIRTKDNELWQFPKS